MHFGALSEVVRFIAVHTLEMSLLLARGAVRVVVLVFHLLSVREVAVGKQIRDFYSRRGGLAFGAAGRRLLLLFLGLLLLLFGTFAIYGACLVGLFVFVVRVFMVFWAIFCAGAVGRGFCGGTVGVADCATVSLSSQLKK
jgi:hypothetical protein